MTQIEIHRNEPRLVLAFARLGGLSLLVSAAVALIGYWPTANVAGRAGVVAMFAGIAVALLGGWIGLIPSFIVLRRDPRQQISGILGGLGLRFAATLALTAAVYFTGAFEARPLILWVAISQLIVLTVDTVGLVGLFKRAAGVGS